MSKLFSFGIFRNFTIAVAGFGLYNIQRRARCSGTGPVQVCGI